MGPCDRVVQPLALIDPSDQFAAGALVLELVPGASTATEWAARVTTPEAQLEDVCWILNDTAEVSAAAAAAADSCLGRHRD